MRLETKVSYRDDFGRFKALIEKAEEDALTESLREIARRARRNAPKDEGHLRASIRSRKTGPKSGIVFATDDAALPQETGARPHPIPNAFGRGITVDHPGNPATRYLHRAMQGSAKRLLDALDRRL